MEGQSFTEHYAFAKVCNGTQFRAVLDAIMMDWTWYELDQAQDTILCTIRTNSAGSFLTETINTEKGVGVNDFQENKRSGDTTTAPLPATTPQGSSGFVREPTAGRRPLLRALHTQRQLDGGGRGVQARGRTSRLHTLHRGYRALVVPWATSQENNFVRRTALTACVLHGVFVGLTR